MFDLPTSQCLQTYQAAEKVGFGVILSEAKNLSSI